jgi:hypothetical protein
MITLPASRRCPNRADWRQVNWSKHPGRLVAPHPGVPGLPLPPGIGLSGVGVSGSARCRGFDLDLELWKGQPSHAEKS